MTESGKTTLAKQLCWSYKRNKIKTIVLDPLLTPDWNSDFQTVDKYEFLNIVKRSRQCAIFIDESGEMIGKYNDEMHWLATRGRHFGHNCHFIVQRIVQLNKTVRDQCAHLFCFSVSITDAKLLADDWGKLELRDANTLKQFEFYHVMRFGDCSKIALNL